MALFLPLNLAVLLMIIWDGFYYIAPRKLDLLRFTHILAILPLQ